MEDQLFILAMFHVRLNPLFSISIELREGKNSKNIVSRSFKRTFSIKMVAFFKKQNSENTTHTTILFYLKNALA